MIQNNTIQIKQYYSIVETSKGSKIFTKEEFNITTIMSKTVKIENLNFAALQKFLTKKIHTNLIDIVSSDYKETLKQVYNDNMVPLIFLYDEVSLFLLFKL